MCNNVNKCELQPSWVTNGELQVINNVNVPVYGLWFLQLSTVTIEIIYKVPLCKRRFVALFLGCVKSPQ